jgi:hypothetical protein
MKGRIFDAHWLGFEEAIAKATYEEDRSLIRTAIQLVQ